MNFAEFKKFKNDCETKKLFIYFRCPSSYFSQTEPEYIRSEWDIAKREFILSFSYISIYNLTPDKYELAYSMKDTLGVKNLYGEDFLNYIFTNIEIEKNAAINQLYNELCNKNETKDDFIPIYFIPQYFYNDRRKMTKLDILKQEILTEFPGLNLYNLSNYDYVNINKKFTNKYGNFIESFKLTIDQEKEYILDTFMKRGSHNFKPSSNAYDIPENICITSLNVYRGIKYKPKDYSFSATSFNNNNNNKSYNNNSYNTKKEYNNFKNNTFYTDNSNSINKKNNSNVQFNNSSHNLSNEDVNDLFNLTSLYNIHQTNVTLENLDTFCSQIGIDSSRADKIKSYILSNPVILNHQYDNFNNENSFVEDISYTTDEHYNNVENEYYNIIEDEYCEYDNFIDNNIVDEYNYNQYENDYDETYDDDNDDETYDDDNDDDNLF